VRAPAESVSLRAPRPDAIGTFSVKIERASWERRYRFFWQASHFNKTPHEKVTPATIDSTAALPCGPRRMLFAGARRVSAPSRSDSDFAEANAAKTTFLQAFERPVYPDARVAGKGKLCRENANQGRCEPGRRAVLEETKEPSDRGHSTPNAFFSQAEIGCLLVSISIVFSGMGCCINPRTSVAFSHCLVAIIHLSYGHLSGPSRFPLTLILASPNETPRFGNAFEETLVKVFRDSIHGDIELAEHEMRAIHTPGFQRLHGCRQLGLTYLVYPAAKHTRFEHVLGVMHIATQIAKNLKYLQDQRPVFDGINGRHLEDVLRLSALLHDIAHVPFGHTLEDEMPQIPEHDAVSDGDRGTSRPEKAVRSVLMESGNEKYIEPVLQTLRAIHESKDDSKLYSSVDNGKIQPELLILADIIGNTICADLLDYIKRDHLMTGIRATYDERIFRYFAVGEHRFENRSYKRLIIGLVKNGRVRGDCLADLLDILKLRYNLSDKVLFHPKKCAADAMLITAVSDLGLDEKALMQLSDDGLLDQHRGHPLIAMLRRRRLFKPVFVCRWEHIHSYDEKEDKREKTGTLRENHALRKKIEQQLAKDLALPGDQPSVLIFCPDPKMSLKLIRVLVHWKDGTIRRLNEIPHSDDPLTVDQVSVLQEIYPELWKLYLFVDPSLRSRGFQIRQRFCELLKAELGVDATCDPAYQHYLETTCKDYLLGQRLDRELDKTEPYLKLAETQRSKIRSQCHDRLPLDGYDEDYAEVVEVASRRDDPALSAALQKIILEVLGSATLP
jgi:HD superfamily phosphohydrolase